MSEDTSWVFDSLVCFLHGPIWNAPLQTFVEEKSLSTFQIMSHVLHRMPHANRISPLVFDPNEKADEANPEYICIHDEYKNLVRIIH